MGKKYFKDTKTLEAIKNFLGKNEIQIPEDFDQKIVESAKKFNEGKLPKITAIENILKACNYWKKYCVTEEDYYDLVCTECYNMARIQCSVIGSQENQKSYIGNYCQVYKELLPECTSTVANYSRAFLYEGLGSGQRVFAPLH